MLGTRRSQYVIQTLLDHGYEAVYVGGAVRDYLRGERPKDIDIATAALPEEIESIFPHTIDVGKEHGTIIVIIEKETIEVTTYRTESQYVDYRRPEHVTFVRSLKEDLRRRDFTMNAIAMTKDGQVIDPFEGRRDLKAGVIRAVGDPNERFQEDALRMMRAFRFAARFHFTIEEETKRAIMHSRHLFLHIARERMKDEFDKWAITNYDENAFRLVQETKFQEVLPLFERASLEQPHPRIGYETNCAMNQWATWALFFDIEVEKFAQAYKWSKKEKQYVVHLIEAYERRKKEPCTNSLLYTYQEIEWVVVEKWREFQQLPWISEEDIRQRRRTLPIQSRDMLAVDGRQLMAWYDRKGGPWLKEMLNRIEEGVIEGAVRNESEAIKEWLERDDKR